MIDGNSIWNLELICNSRTGDVKQSLYGVLNFTNTMAGGETINTVYREKF